MLKNKFSINSKKVIILGGNGLIGSAITKLFSENGGEVIVIDKKKSKNIQGIKEYICDISDLNKIEKIFKIKEKNFVPNIFINCTYPKTRDWKKTNYKKVKYDYLKKNIEIHLNSHIWLAKIFADMMKKNKTEGSIIQLASIYGFLGQDNSLQSFLENLQYLKFLF